MLKHKHKHYNADIKNVLQAVPKALLKVLKAPVKHSIYNLRQFLLYLGSESTTQIFK